MAPFYSERLYQAVPSMYKEYLMARMANGVNLQLAQ